MVQRRGHAQRRLAELLIGLEHAASEDVAAALAEASGTERFDGRAQAPGLAALSLRPVRALPIALEGDELTIAAIDPFDVEAHTELARTHGARRVRIQTAEARVLSELMERRRPAEEALLEADEPDEGDTSEAGWRTRWAHDAPPRIRDDDGPIPRLTNVLFLRLGWLDGAAFRLEAFDVPAVRDVDPRQPHLGPTRPTDLLLTRALVRRCGWRMRSMAGAPGGGVSASGTIVVQLTHDARQFSCAFEPTERGHVTLALSTTPWFGWGAPEDRRWDRYRAEHTRTVAAAARGDTEAVLAGWRACHREAERIGPEAVIESIDADLRRSAACDAAGREDDAIADAERALAAVRAAELGARADADGTEQLAEATRRDVDRRAALLARAEALTNAPGVGRARLGNVALDLAIAHRHQGDDRSAAEAAERAIADDLRWFGALTVRGVLAHLELALAAHAAGDGARAAVSARRCAEASSAIARLRPPDTEPFVRAWALGIAAAAEGRHGDAERRLADASEHCDAPDALPYIAALRAAALDALGRRDDASTVAKKALARSAGTPVLARIERELASVAARSAYR